MKKVIAVFALVGLFSFTASVQEEGMFPLSSLSKLDLKKAGLKIEPSEIYNEEGNSLVNALVRLGGCTGSFISDQGLIITNHHCVFGSVAALSTPENNYLENGFYASSNEQELKTTLPCKITKSFTDVSDLVLKGVDDLTDAIEKQKKIAENRKGIIAREKEMNPEMLIEISEMLVGKVYTLFRYKELNDVRIVYVPPKNMGKFGGDTDNWEWPRHNGDFSIVRAYENGKPYQPEKHLEVNPGGTKEGDFTFILGYPGRTYRNQPAEYMEYQQQYILPIIAEWFDFQIASIEKFAGNDVAKQLKYGGRVASLNNTAKNFKGKMQGIQRTGLVAQMQEKQMLLKDFAKDNAGYSDYLPLFDKSTELHKRKFELITDVLYMGQFIRTSKVFGAAYAIGSYQELLQDMSGKQQDSTIDARKERLAQQFAPYFNSAAEMSLEQDFFGELIYQVSNTALPELKTALGRLAGMSRDEAKDYTAGLFAKSELNDPLACKAVFEKKPKKFLKLKDPMVSLVRQILPVYQSLQQEFGSVNAQIDEIIPRFNDLDMASHGGTFIPDANGTLRFTYGYVKGYEPEDAVAMSPFTTIKGIIEKSEGSSNPDYFLEKEVIEKLKTIEPADILKHPEHDAVVVGFLYNMDTTGGNSGSPIMDAYGRIVGVNFDRAYTATINDYAWNESYSRSIGVDIRYVLYIMKYFGEADEVLDEMGVEL